MNARMSWRASIGALGLVAAAGSCGQVRVVEQAKTPPAECTAESAATACDDQNACTADTCVAGKCSHAPQMAGIACGMGGSCDGAGSCQDGAPVWSKLFADAAPAYLWGLGVDGQGNIFVGGQFHGSLTFEGITLTADGGAARSFLAELHPDGSIAWAKDVTGDVPDLTHLAVDASGQIAAAGDDVIAQYDGTCVLLWRRTIEHPQGTAPIVTALGVDPGSSDVLVAARFDGSVDLGTVTYTTNKTDYDVDSFVARLKPGPGGGTTTWATQIGGSSVGFRLVTGVAADGHGVIHAVGFMHGDLSIGPNDLVSAAMSTSGYDIMYTSFDPEGVSPEAHLFGSGGDQEVWAIAPDPAGNVVFTGAIIGTMSFGDKSLMTGAPNTFLAKFGTPGLLYSDAWGPGMNSGRSVATDKDSNIILAGYALGTVSFGGTDIPTPGPQVPYVAKLDASAKHIWSHGFGDAMTVSGITQGVATDPVTRQVIVGINFEGTVDLAGDKLSAPAGGFVVAKLNP